MSVNLFDEYNRIKGMLSFFRVHKKRWETLKNQERIQILWRVDPRILYGMPQDTTCLCWDDALET